MRSRPWAFVAFSTIIAAETAIMPVKFGGVVMIKREREKSAFSFESKIGTEKGYH